MSGIALFSFFAGLGLLDLGFESEGFTIVFVNEIDPVFLNSYQNVRETMDLKQSEFSNSDATVWDFLKQGKERDHLSDLISSARHDYDLVGFIAGPPCPDFSSAGNHLGRNGNKGILTQTYVDLIEQHKPDFFLFENVYGLWRTKKHREYYEEIKHLLNKNCLCYATTESLINALHYGVPQDRNRVFWIGFRPALLRKLGYAPNDIQAQLRHEIFDWDKHISFTQSQIDQVDWPATEEFGVDLERPASDYQIIKPLTVEYWFRKNDVYKHPNSKHYFRPHAISRFMNIPEGDVSGKSFKRLHRWRYSPTAAYGNNEVHLHPYKARRISAAEALAIQSAPREFILPEDVTLTNMFKMITNGVPYLMARGIARTLIEFLGVASN